MDVAVLDTEPATIVTAEQMAIDRLVQQFQFPLESAGATVDLIKPEFESMLSYAGHFISLATTDYQSVWWRIFHPPNCKEWTNLLIFI